MRTIHRVSAACIAAAIACGPASAPALAEKPEWAGQGKGKGKEKHAKKFDGDQRANIRVYYDEEFRGGRCPPGLAKKNNGCMPPGQAKKWRVGQPLAQDVVFYEVPTALVVKIGVPPPGYKYVRVAADILMIAVGTRMVVDAIADLGRV